MAAWLRLAPAPASRLTRGVVTGTAIVDKENLEMNGFPTVRERVNVRLGTTSLTAGSCCRNANGQTLDIRPVQLTVGHR